LVIKRVDRTGGIVFGDQLSRKAQQQLSDAIKAEPWRYVGQERVSFSTVPTLAGDGLAPRHLVLRSFLAGDGEHYDVMPGALCRVAGAAENLAVSTQGGGWSKATWLLRRGGSMRDVLRLHPAGQRRVAAAVLTSRAAENLFWAASYLERSESLLRLVMAYQKRYETWLDYGFDSDLRVLRQWLPLLQLYLPGLYRDTTLQTFQRGSRRQKRKDSRAVLARFCRQNGTAGASRTSGRSCLTGVIFIFARCFLYLRRHNSHRWWAHSRHVIPLRYSSASSRTRDFYLSESRYCNTRLLLGHCKLS